MFDSLCPEKKTVHPSAQNQDLLNGYTYCSSPAVSVRSRREKMIGVDHTRDDAVTKGSLAQDRLRCQRLVASGLGVGSRRQKTRMLSGLMTIFPIRTSIFSQTLKQILERYCSRVNKGAGSQDRDEARNLLSLFTRWSTSTPSLRYPLRIRYVQVLPDKDFGPRSALDTEMDEGGSLVPDGW